MRHILLSFIFLVTLGYNLTAQDTRTVVTKIADLLAKTPADDATQLLANAEAVANLGEDGLVQLVTGLGNGDPTKVEFAITGFNFYATQAGRENWRSLAVKAYGKALQQAKNPETALFLLTALEQVGKNDAIGIIQPYLTDARLADPAARALATIGSDAAGKALMEALATSTGKAKIAVIAAIGDMNYPPAEDAVTALSATTNPEERKAVLNTLASLGSAKNLKTLQQAAQAAGYTFEASNATGAYLTLLGKMAANPSTQAVAVSSLNKLVKQAKSPAQLATKLAATKLLLGASSDPVLLLNKALKDKNPAFKAAAIQIGASSITDSNIGQLTKAFTQASPEVQTSLLQLFGNKALSGAAPLVVQSLSSKNSGVKLAAITALARVAPSQSVSALTNIITNGNTAEVNAAKTALLSVKSDNLVDVASEALSSANPSGKAALLEIIGSKAATAKLPQVIALVKDNDPVVAKTARKALGNLTDRRELQQVYNLLIAENDVDAVKDYQQAVIGALKNSGNARLNSANIIGQLKKAPANKQHLFYPILAGVGSNFGIKTVADGFRVGDANVKQIVVESFTNWQDGEAADALYEILKNTPDASVKTKVLAGYLKQIGSSSATADQKLIQLRNAMEYATTVEEKRRVLSLVQQSPTFLAVMFAGQYLGDADLNRQAGSTISSIMLSTPSINGKNVKQLLERSIDALGRGNENEYLKEAIRKHLVAMPDAEGFVPLFNGTDLTGWKGLVANPIKRGQMDAKTLAAEQVKADEKMRTGWSAKDGLLIFNGKGDNLSTVKKYGDFEMYVDWKISKDGDAGIYLRGTPQVQIWDTARRDVGAQVGSGGLYNNEKNPSKPLVMADNPIDDWNSFYITMIGDQVTVHLNGQLVVDKVPLENFWDRSLPIFPEEYIELQAHGTYVAYRDIYIKEIPRPTPYVLTAEEKKEGFKILFDGSDMHEWVGNKTAYIIEEGNIAVYPKRGGNGNLFTKDEYTDFTFRFEFKLTPGANNGLGIRAPLTGDAAYEGLELQILDDGADIYKDLKDYQYHGSVYGIVPAKRGSLKPVGEWNQQEVIVKGDHIKITLNGNVIIDANVAEASKNGTLDGKKHPGLNKKSGHVGFLGHGDIVFFKNIRIKDETRKTVQKKK